DLSRRRTDGALRLSVERDRAPRGDDRSVHGPVHRDLATRGHQIAVDGSVDSDHAREDVEVGAHGLIRWDSDDVSRAYLAAQTADLIRERGPGEPAGSEHQRR